MLGERMIGPRLKHMREARNLTQEQVGEYVGVSSQQVYRWETEKNDPTGDMIVQLARLLEVTTDYLLGLVDDPTAHITETNLSPMERRLIAALRNGQLTEALHTFTSLADGSEKPGAARKQ
jgi:transcriptional regulator with XRE-family HTH domain